MKKILVTTAALLALTAGLAMAQGSINIAWNDCPPGAGGTGAIDQINACTSNTGSLILVASFQPPADMPHFNGHAGVVDVQVAAATLDAWWHMEAGGCRDGKLVADYSFLGGPFNCADPWLGAASGGTNVGTVGTNRIRVRTVCAVAGVSPLLADGTEYYVFKLFLAKAQSTGAGSCLGCLDPACIVFNNLLITQPAGEGDYVITSGPQQYATYKGSVGVVGGCPAATPTHKGTWGSVKALYR